MRSLKTSGGLPEAVEFPTQRPCGLCLCQCPLPTVMQCGFYSPSFVTMNKTRRQDRQGRKIVKTWRKIQIKSRPFHLSLINVLRKIITGVNANKGVMSINPFLPFGREIVATKEVNHCFQLNTTGRKPKTLGSVGIDVAKGQKNNPAFVPKFFCGVSKNC
ncbi:hypothetical protein GWK47_000013 [Chionoecetes opilio]|uniref:Uncharacterized protein n=1 Tax=Chionoecetes opilio TaxID=41210 RepID=A0A8J5CKR1_CHIOP|nr:hypothetical protein GWK47_000013 [Chionoecetes opilio]